MATTLHQFNVGLYTEHLTEAGFLLTYRQSYFADASIAWLDVEESEERLAAHVDSIDLGGELAYQCALEFLVGGDEDQILGAVYVASSINDKGQALTAVVDAFTKAPDDQLHLYVEAFKHVRHPLLSEKLLTLLGHERLIIRVACTEILGYRREGDPKHLWPLLRHPDAMVSGAAVIALVRWGDRSALPALEQAIFDIKPAPQSGWQLPLLLLGSRRALQELTRTGSASADTPVGLMCLAMAAGREAYVILARAVQFPEMKAPAYAALGVFGDIHGIPHLLDGLNSSDAVVRLEAANALQLITGAGLTENLTVEEPDEDLTPEDITGEPKKTAAESPNPPRTHQVQRVCTQPEPWQRWWHAHAKPFNAAPRWRHGQPFTLQTCIEDLANPHRNAQARQHAHMELLIRSGQSIAFESDEFIAKQLQSIAAWRAWWQGAQAAFTNPWTFDGH